MYMWGFLIKGKKQVFLGQNTSKWKADIYTIVKKKAINMPVSHFLLRLEFWMAVSGVDVSLR